MDFIPFYRRPAFQTALGLVFLAAVYLWAAISLDQTWTASGLVVDMALGAIALLSMIALASQFALPVRTWEQRSAAYNRLLGHLAGARGPVMFIKDGEAREAHRERERRGPGVLVIDSASAAVLRTDVQFTRAAGPGVVFTQSGERLAEALDLRRQLRGIGGGPPGRGPTHLLGVNPGRHPRRHRFARDIHPRLWTRDSPARGSHCRPHTLRVQPRRSRARRLRQGPRRR